MNTQPKKRLVNALATIALVVCSTSIASAKTFDLNTLISGTTFFGYFHDPAAAPFSDTFNFTLGGASNSNIFSVGALSVPAAFAITGIAMSLSGPGAGGAIPVTPFTTPTSYAFSVPTLTAGNYSLQVTGIVPPGNFAGGYFGSITVAPVPEPEVWAMMLAGLGLIGYRLGRKSAGGGLTIAAV